MLSSSRIAFISLFLFFILEFALDHFWREYTPYLKYGAEFIFICGLTFFYPLKKFLHFPKGQTLSFHLFAALISGFLTYKGIVFIKVPIPFPFNSIEIIFWLLIVAPVLEELIFRWGLWEPLTQLLPKNKLIPVLVSGLLFSAAHFMVYPHLPEQIKTFVLIQAFYTLILGIAIGLQRLRYQSLSLPILTHFAFNLGFYSGSQL